MDDYSVADHYFGIVTLVLGGGGIFCWCAGSLLPLIPLAGVLWAGYQVNMGIAEAEDEYRNRR